MEYSHICDSFMLLILCSGVYSFLSVGFMGRQDGSFGNSC